jgi:DNA invertase Pin-like site-specific DNA recombinase
MTTEKPSEVGRRVVAYVRVSVEREEMISPELQLIAITDYCKRHGYTIVRTMHRVGLSTASDGRRS